MTRFALLVPLIVLAGAPTAAAQTSGSMTVLTGVYSAARAKPAIGYAWGFGKAGGGGELEYAGTRGSGEEAGSITLAWFIPTPLKVRRSPVYGIAGFGAYADSHRAELQETIVAGMGTKVQVAGPIKLRIEYRLFLLRDAFPPPRRLSAGLSVGF